MIFAISRDFGSPVMVRRMYESVQRTSQNIKAVFLGISLASVILLPAALHRINTSVEMIDAPCLMVIGGFS